MVFILVPDLGQTVRSCYPGERHQRCRLVIRPGRHFLEGCLTCTGRKRGARVESALLRERIGEQLRTQQTAASTATLLGITPVALTASDVAGLVSTIRSNHYGQKVLVVGHSDTVPQIIAEFGGPVVTIGSNEYDNLYVLTLCRCRWESARLANLQYGAAWP